MEGTELSSQSHKSHFTGSTAASKNQSGSYGGYGDGNSFNNRTIVIGGKEFELGQSRQTDTELRKLADIV